MRFKRQTSSGSGSGAEKSWYKDKYESVRQQRDILSAITLLSLLLAAASVLTVMWLTPYKSVEPYVIQIDEKAGIVRQVASATRNQFTANEAVARYFVAQYIRAREGYVSSIFASNYSMVRVMSAPGVFSEYWQAVGPSNPQSPMNILTNQANRSVFFKSMSFVKSNSPGASESMVAVVRVRLNDLSEIPMLLQEQHKVITLQFRYANLSLNEEERFMNPIGFIVESYQIEQEVV